MTLTGIYKTTPALLIPSTWSHMFLSLLSRTPIIVLSISLADSGWSVENVTTEKTTVSGDQSTVQCSSTHLTSFAVLVDVRGVKVRNM